MFEQKGQNNSIMEIKSSFLLEKNCEAQQNISPQRVTANK